MMPHPTHPGPHLFRLYTSSCHIFFFPEVTLTAISLYAIPLFCHTLRAISLSLHTFMSHQSSVLGHISLHSTHTHTQGVTSHLNHIFLHTQHTAPHLSTRLYTKSLFTAHIRGSHLFLHTTTPHLSSRKTHTGSHLFRHTLGHSSRQPHTQGHTKSCGTLTPRATPHCTPLRHPPPLTTHLTTPL